RGGAFRRRSPRRRLPANQSTSRSSQSCRTGATMSHHINQFAFQIYPYIALAVFFIGSWARFDRAAYTWRTGSSQMLSDRGMRWGSNLFHVGILAILGGHLVGLLTPHWLYEHFITAPQKQLLAMVVGGVFGLLCLV